MCSARSRFLRGSSVGDAESTANVPGLLELIEQRYRGILEVDEALAFIFDEKRFVGRAVPPCAFSRRDLSGRADIRPIEAVRLRFPDVQRVSAFDCFALVRGWKVGRVHDCLTGWSLQAACADDEEHAANSCMKKNGNQRARVVVVV